MGLNKCSWKQECAGCGRVHLFRPKWELVHVREREDRAELTLRMEDRIKQPMARPGHAQRIKT